MSLIYHFSSYLSLFFFNDPATTEIYTLSLHDALPILSAQTVFGHLSANAEAAKKVLIEAIPRIPPEPDWPEHQALDSALITDRKLWPAATLAKLGPILARFA